MAVGIWHFGVQSVVLRGAQVAFCAFIVFEQGKAVHHKWNPMIIGIGIKVTEHLFFFFFLSFILFSVLINAMHQPQQLLDNISNPNFDIFDFCLNRMSSLSLQRFDRAIARILLEDINDPQVWRMTSTVKELFDVILHVMLYRFGERAREIAGDEPLEGMVDIALLTLY